GARNRIPAKTSTSTMSPSVAGVSHDPEPMSALRLRENRFFMHKCVTPRTRILGHDTGTAHDRCKRIGSDMNRHAEHLRQELGKPANERAAAKHRHPALKHVREKLWRCPLDDLLHRLHERLH